MILHPGVAVALRRLSADELDVANMMAAGELASPQRYHNITFYVIRITGTGVSYRPKLDEFVFRRPEDYLTDRFCKRCGGLPVLWGHPEKGILSSPEFTKRIVGTIMFAFIRDDEIWAIARLYDAAAIRELEESQLSTSPAVLVGQSVKMTTEDGKNVLYEGAAPLLTDHVAICQAGVWDKGGDATGVEQHNVMEEARADSVEREPSRLASSRLDGALHSLTMLRHDAAILISRQLRRSRDGRK